MSDFCSEGGQNSSDNVFSGLFSDPEETGLVSRFLDDHDFAAATRRAIIADLRKFADWFLSANAEIFSVKRIAIRDVADFKADLRRNQGQAVATVNRCLVSLRRYFAWLVDRGHLEANPAKPVKELRRQELAPKGLERSEVRRLLREIELREDIRANAIVSMFLYTGCRVGDLVALKLRDIFIADRSGTVIFRCGKGNKQRSVPLPLPARRALQAYLDVRPPSECNHLFIGERGPLTDRGVRALCDKYSAVVGVELHPHLLRHTFAHRYLDANPGDLVGLAQILGHSNLNTTRRYVEQTEEQLADGIERMNY